MVCKNLEFSFSVASSVEPQVMRRFQSGFVECATEVKRYLNQVDALHPDVRTRLVDHLNRCSNSINNVMTSATDVTSHVTTQQQQQQQQHVLIAQQLQQQQQQFYAQPLYYCAPAAPTVSPVQFVGLPTAPNPTNYPLACPTPNRAQVNRSPTSNQLQNETRCVSRNQSRLDVSSLSPIPSHNSSHLRDAVTSPVPSHASSSSLASDASLTGARHDDDVLGSSDQRSGQSATSLETRSGESDSLSSAASASSSSLRPSRVIFHSTPKNSNISNQCAESRLTAHAHRKRTLLLSASEQRVSGCRKNNNNKDEKTKCEENKRRRLTSTFETDSTCFENKNINFLTQAQNNTNRLHTTWPQDAQQNKENQPYPTPNPSDPSLRLCLDDDRMWRPW